MSPTSEEPLDANHRPLFVLMWDVMEEIQFRLLALQDVLEAKGVVTNAEVESVQAKMRALRDAVALELEYGADPLYEQFRQMRRFVEGGGEPPKEA
jgi:hypothetical protein